MRRRAHLVCAGWLALVFLLSFATPDTSFASAANPPPIPTGRYEHVQAGDDGSLTLLANAPPAPAVYGAFTHFGIAISPAQQLSTPFHIIHVTYEATTPPGTAVRLDVRASADGVRWTAWEVGLSSGASATFERPARFAQYRATLLGNGRLRPTVRAIALTPERGTAVYTAMQDQPPVAPTYRVHATRMGMVGARTANGHRIGKRDHFVSLPSWRALSSNGGSEYMVRVTYNGRSSVAPVYEVGPWNIHDNYWDEKRERFSDLPRGYPEDHAAYFDKYNGGKAEKGRVSFPTAIDIGDGVWWDDLGIKGDRAVVEVTFLWLGRDPLAAEEASVPAAAPVKAAPPAEKPAEVAPPAPPAPPAEAAPPAPPAEAAPPPAPAEKPAPPPEIVVDNSSAGFKGQAAIKWYDGPSKCGSGGHALWTYSTPDPGESENSGRWQPAIPTEAMYDVYVAIPGCAVRKPNTGSAHYVVQHRDGVQDVVVDQAAGAGKWVLLGRFPFRSGEGGFVELRDVTGDSMRTIWFDAVKWVRAQ